VSLSARIAEFSLAHTQQREQPLPAVPLTVD